MLDVLTSGLCLEHWRLVVTSVLICCCQLTAQRCAFNSPKFSSAGGALRKRHHSDFELPDHLQQRDESRSGSSEQKVM